MALTKHSLLHYPIVSNRRHLSSPPDGEDKDAPEGKEAKGGVHAMRRGGVRREVSERVTLSEGERVLEGWALNVSRGGVRLILEEKVELGEEFDIEVGAEDSLKRRGRVVWVQEEKDGVIVGIEFVTLSGTHKSVPPAAPGEGESESDGLDAASGTVAKPDTKPDS